MRPAAPPSCPQCGQLDQTRKVSAIYDAETGWTTGPQGGGVRTQSRLAARLEPPKRPAARSCLTSLFGLILFGLVALSGGCAVLGWLISSLTGDTNLSLVPVIGGPPLLALLLVSGVALPWRVGTHPCPCAARRMGGADGGLGAAVLLPALR